MTLLAFAAVAAIMLGQQPAPLVSQTELPPPVPVQQQAPAESAQQAVQQAPHGLFAQQQQPPETGAAPPVKAAKQEAAGKSETRGAGGKRVVAFWVILPEKSK